MVTTRDDTDDTDDTDENQLNRAARQPFPHHSTILCNISSLFYVIGLSYPHMQTLFT